jgi:putative SOS response-associated peptidase YedK
MPGRLILTTPLDALCSRFGASTTLAPQSPRRNVQPGQQIVVLTPERRLEAMRWGIVPVGRVNARGRPVMEVIVNARSETVFEKSAFAGTGRAVVPADGWYEWTGEKRKKTAWRITSADGAALAFAAIIDRWQAPGGSTLWQVAPITCEPNAEIAPIHDRMGVILAPEDICTWLTGQPDEVAALTRPWPEGRLKIEPAGEVDWNGP